MILLTKVRPPQRRKDVLRRVRLLDTLHQNLHRKLTFVSAPAGYGKTTLLIDFAEDIDAQVFWYLIGPDDNDLSQFMRHVVAAFQQRIPDFGQGIEQSLAAPGAGPDSASLAAELINEIERRVTDFSLLVLDDYHLAGENQQIVDLIEHLLEHLPDQLRILMGSRSVYGIPTANLYIRDELITISAEELRFRPSELQRLVSQNYHVRLSQEQAEELATRADGWIVAIMLAVRSMENGALPKFSGAMDQVYEFLAQEVVQRQKPELREFMLATSIFTDFNAELCNFVLERDDTERDLRALEDRNLFVTRTETNDGHNYRYHQLFSEFLRQRLEQSDPERLKALNQKAAEWFRRAEQWELAVRHKLEAGEAQAAAEWMDGIAYHFYTTGRQTQLGRWYDILSDSPELLRLAPHLLLYQAKAAGNQIDIETSERLLDIAEPVLAERGEKEALANALTTRGMLRRYQGQYADAVRLAEEAQSLLRKQNGRGSGAHQHYQAERLKALANYYLGNSEDAVQQLNKAITGLRELIEQSNNLDGQRVRYDLAQSLSDLGLFSISSGRLVDAQRAYREALEIHQSNRTDQAALALARNNMGYLYHQIGNYKEAWREYQLASQTAHATARHRVIISVANGMGAILNDLEELDEAKRHYKQAIQTGFDNELEAVLSTSFMGLADIERQRGNFNLASDHLREAASRRNQQINEPLYHILRGRNFLDMGQAQLALDEFNAVLESTTGKSRATPEECLANFFRAVALEQTGEKGPAREAMQATLKLLANLGYSNFFVVAARPSLDFIKAQQNDLDSPQLKSLIEDMELFSAGSTQLDVQPEKGLAPDLHLEVRAFGPGEVRLDGELLSASDWRSTRARALFFYILDGGKVRKEAIGLEFWPDFSPGKVSSNFHATLWRVRQALGHKEAIQFENDSYSLHPEISAWYDVNEFERLIEQSSQTDLSELGRTELLRQAVGLYSGNFLEDIYMDWVDERRDALQAHYIEALETLARRRYEAKQYSEAVDLYKKIIEADPYQDKVHLAIMQCHAAAGSPSAARAHFQDYRQMLHDELNAEPIPALQAFIDQLAI
jgi:ATP/maltotriose-dependent transcriptional regulator MalT/DNA-binding SARP family transcriptional activator